MGLLEDECCCAAEIIQFSVEPNRVQEYQLGTTEPTSSTVAALKDMADMTASPR
ncbi:hypothetical protein BDR06DRAFT_963301 [Suillus hirtellus]|nr:hypothetical protein BDR06DRAFT_963301 [Suillus hirtellus]